MPTYDHEVLIGSTKRGLTLARDQNGQAMYDVQEKVLPYQDPLTFAQTNWSGGHGQYDFIKDDLYFDGQSIDTTIEGKAFLGPLINEVKEDDGSGLDAFVNYFFWFASVGILLAATTNTIYHLDAGGWDVSATVGTLGDGVTGFCEYNGVCYAARGAAEPYVYSTNGVTWTATDLTNHHAHGFIVAPNPAGTQDILWKWEKPNQITNTTDGRTAGAGGVAWSSPAYIGSPSTASFITGMFLVNGYLMIGRTDGLYYYDTDGGVHPIMSELITSRNNNNFLYIANWQTGSYFSLGTGLGEITSYDTFDVVGPLSKIDDLSKTGIVAGLTSDKDWLYCAVREGSNSYVIYKGREITRDTTKWVWCPWIYIPTYSIGSLLVVQHSATDRRLWFNYTSTTTGYVILSDNPLADSTARFCPSGFLRMSYLNGTNLSFDKMFQQPLVTETLGCTANLTVQPKYRKDVETTMTNLTAAITTNGTVKTAVTTAIAGNRVQFEVDFATNSSSSTPQVLFFQAAGLEKPDVIRIHHATYTAGTNPSSSVETLRTLLRLARTTTTLIKWADLRYTPSGTGGTDYSYVVMEPGYPKEVEIFKGKDKSPELGFEVAWRVAT